VALKALAFRDRHKNKDAYDLHYVIRHYGAAVEDVTERLRPLLDDWDAQRAITYLREDFAGLDSAGPRAVAAFLLRADDDGFKADVAGLVGRLTGSL
jgi:predicted nucleotidyltransferase